MILEACFWKIEWKETCSSWIGLYSGKHNHNKPPLTGKLPDRVAIGLTEKVLQAPEATPHQLQKKTIHRKPVSNLHNVLYNRGKVAYERRKYITEGSVTSPIGAIMAFFATIQKSIGPKKTFLDQAV